MTEFGAARPRDRGRHTIARASYPLGEPGDRGTIRCACGWDGPVPAFQPHRTEMGAVRRKDSDAMAHGPRPGW